MVSVDDCASVSRVCVCVREFHGRGGLEFRGPGRAPEPLFCLYPLSPSCPALGKNEV